MLKFFRSVALVVLGLMALSFRASAQQIFDINWSGVSFGNTAEATGTITLTPSLLLSSGDTDLTGFFFPPAIDYVSALSVTVSGSVAGNGTFALSDFDDVLFDQNGGALNFREQLVGQATAGSPWGTPDGNGGDFNLFNLTAPGQPDAPDGVFNFTLVTDAGLGDEMQLTSFAPATPEPGSLAIFVGVGIASTAFLRKRRAR